MILTNAHSRVFRRLGVRTAFAASVLVCLFACTSNPSHAPNNKDLVTESDESDARKRAKIRLELAIGYYNNGQTTIALDELKQSIAADSSLYEAHNLRGLIYMRLNDIPLAEESFKQALVLNPNDPAIQHNLGWLYCQQGRMPEAYRQFAGVLSNPRYSEKAKTWLAQAVCYSKEGRTDLAEASFMHAYELDPGNPITGYNIALLLFQRKEFSKAQFYVRRINNGELANAETLWLGVRVERSLGNVEAQSQLAVQLKKRFPQSKEATLLERGAFNE